MRLACTLLGTSWPAGTGKDTKVQQNLQMLEQNVHLAVHFLTTVLSLIKKLTPKK